MKFIAIDGLDGSGKDTQIDLLANYYRNQGKNVVVRSHPCDDNRYGRKSRQALLGAGKIDRIKATVYFGLDAIRSVRKYSHDDSIDVLIFSRYAVSALLWTTLGHTLILIPLLWHNKLKSGRQKPSSPVT